MKRGRQSEEEPCGPCVCRAKRRKKKHLYLALYERGEGGSICLAIHKLDADDMPDDDDAALPEPAFRFAAPERAPMAVTAVGTSIFVATSPHLSISNYRNESSPPPPPTLVYDTATGALTIGPRLPDGYLEGDAGVPTAVGGDRLYALTEAYDRELRQDSVSLSVLSRRREASSWVPSETAMAWSWKSGGRRAPPPLVGRHLMTSYAVHPDGRTIFMSTSDFTWSVDTGAGGRGGGAWKELGHWSLPFTGQAFFDGDLDAWVGLRRDKDRHLDVCCCRVPVPSRSASASASADAAATAAAPPPEFRTLRENLFFCGDDEDYSIRRRQKATLTYMGDSRFCLVESVPNSAYGLDAMLHVTLFGLRYDRNGELCTKVRCTTRSYGVSFNNQLFPHAAFWM